MTDAVVVGSLDGVGVVSGAFDDSRIGAVPTSVEFMADLVHGGLSETPYLISEVKGVVV
jgi:hypothetical protein